MISEEKLVILTGKIIPDQQHVHSTARWTLYALTDFDQVLTSSFNV
jgi:hypothetical protein